MTDKEIKQTFDEVHMPSALLGKIEEGIGQKEKKGTGKPWKMAVAAAAFTLCLTASNAICYAATGHSLLGKISMYVNGEEVAYADVELKQDGDSITATLGDLPDDAHVEVELPEPDRKDFSDQDPDNIDAFAQDKGETPENVTFQVREEGGRVYLSVKGGSYQLDITEDIADKKAEGTFTWKDVVYHYYVREDNGKYSIFTDIEH